MEVLTIEHSAFQQLISKIDAMDEFIRKTEGEQAFTKTLRTGPKPLQVTRVLKIIPARPRECVNATKKMFPKVIWVLIFVPT